MVYGVTIAEDAVVALRTHAQLVVQTGSFAVALVRKVAWRIVRVIATRHSVCLWKERTHPAFAVAGVVGAIIAVVAVRVFATLPAGGITGTDEAAEKIAGTVLGFETLDATVVLFVAKQWLRTWVMSTTNTVETPLIAVAEQFIRARSQVWRMTRLTCAISIASVRVRADRVRRIATRRSRVREPDYAIPGSVADIHGVAVNIQG